MHMQLARGFQINKLKVDHIVEQCEVDEMNMNYYSSYHESKICVVNHRCINVYEHLCKPAVKYDDTVPSETTNCIAVD